VVPILANWRFWFYGKVMLTVKQLRYFVEIVDCGSFSLAAERLFIAQSALSRQVKEMESLMGVTLLARDTRPLEAPVRPW